MLVKNLMPWAPGVIGFLQDLAEDLDVFIAFFRRDMLDYDFMNHFHPLLGQRIMNFAMTGVIDAKSDSFDQLMDPLALVNVKLGCVPPDLAAVIV